MPNESLFMLSCSALISLLCSNSYLRHASAHFSSRLTSFVAHCSLTSFTKSLLFSFKSCIDHLLSDRVYSCVTTKCVSDFNKQSNIFLADFKNVNSDIINYLFQCYCSSFY